MIRVQIKDEAFCFSILNPTAGGNGLQVNADETEYMCFNHKGDIGTLIGGSQKLVDKFTYLGSSVSSTANDISMLLTKAWTAVGRLLIIWKSDLSHKIKQIFFPISGRVNSTIWMHHIDTDYAYREKAGRELHKNATSYMKQILDATSCKTEAVWPSTSHLKIHPNKMNKTCGTLLEKQEGTHKQHSPIDTFTRMHKC